MSSQGAHIVLSALSIRPILQRRKRFLLVYILLLFSFATASFGLQAWWTQVAFIKNSNYPGGSNQFLLDNVNSPVNNAVTALCVHYTCFTMAHYSREGVGILSSTGFRMVLSYVRTRLAVHCPY